MSMDEMVAAFGAAQPSVCRVCKGTTKENRPYCLRHFRMLWGRGRGQELMKAVAAGESLEEADAFIALREQFKLHTMWIPEIGLRIGAYTTLKHVGSEWVLRRTLKNGQEQELGRFPDVMAAGKAVIASRVELSAHNLWATKTLIR